MGQGDKKTRKGKIWRGSYGNTRKHKVAKKKPASSITIAATMAPITMPAM